MPPSKNKYNKCDRETFQFFSFNHKYRKKKSAANAKRKNNKVVTVTPLSYAYNAKMGINANPVADNNISPYPFHMFLTPQM